MSYSGYNYNPVNYHTDVHAAGYSSQYSVYHNPNSNIQYYPPIPVSDCDWMIGPHQQNNGYYGYYENLFPHENQATVPISPTNGWSTVPEPQFVPPSISTEGMPTSLVSPIPETAVVPTDKGNITEEEKKGSTLWRMLNEIDTMEELAMTMTGSRPLKEIKAEDVLEFENSDITNCPMPTDELILNFRTDPITF